MADDNGWTLGHAVRVVSEYRRFLVLTQVAGTPVCPSDDVDKAWHLHITRTANYERFCAAALGALPQRPPPSEDAEELARRRTVAAATLSRYLAAFGIDPPRVVWPPVADPPDAEEPSRQTVLRLRGWLADPFFALGVLLMLAFGAAVPIGLAGGFPVLRAVPDVQLGEVSLAAPCVLFLVAWGSTLRGGRRSWRDKLDPYELAWLLGGARRMAATAIGVLVERGALELRPRRDTIGKVRDATLGVVARGVPPVAEHPVERACRAAGARGTMTFSAASRRIEPLASDTGRRLVRAGLAVDPATIEPGRAALLGSTWLCLVVAVERLAQGLTVSRPVGFFFVLAVADGALMAWILLRMTRVTPRGRSVVDNVREWVCGESVLAPRLDTAGLARLPCSLALFGAPAMMHDPRFAGIEFALDREGVIDDDS